MGIAIAVLGMHRSGTSCLTGLLEDAGIFLGDVSRENPYNIKGNHERLDIMNLHEAVLADNGGTWDNPPNTPLVWSETDRRRLRELVGHYADHRYWAFKDPRTLFTIEAWLREIPALQCIGTFRHPLAVAKSLRSRHSSMPVAEALELWERYNRRLLDLWNQRRFPLVSFDCSPATYVASVHQAIVSLGISCDQGQLMFFDDNLRHGTSNEEDGSIPERIRVLHRELQQCAQHP